MEKLKLLKIAAKFFMTLLQTVLIILKLTGVLNVSWWIILLPVIVPFALALIFLIVAFVLSLTADEYEPNL